MGRTTLDTAALAHDLRLAVTHLSRRLRSHRAGTSLTLTQLAALSTLRAKGPLTPGELAACERVQPPSMTRVLATLEGADLIVRTKHATDGRQVIVQVTDKATGMLDEEIRMREAWLAQRLN
nr:MarR family transcriptional regulator [Geodermatophilaceae bacterium]